MSCLPCREHVVPDEGSTDGTIDLVKRYGCRLLPQDRRFLSADGRIVDFGGIATLRITIGHSEALGKGFGSEAVALLKDYAFSVAHWKLLTLRVLEENVRAILTYERAGFVSTGEDLQDGKTICTMTLEADSFLKHS